MPRKKKEGECCICGKFGTLSFEHLPPQSAFNKNTVTMADLDTALKVHPLDPPVGRFKQGGFGAFTLCNKCNNDTGAWYGNEYVSWAERAARVLRSSSNDPRLVYEYRGYPLRFVKQVVTMLFSACGPELRSAYPELAEFVMVKERSGFVRGLQLYALYNPTNRIRNFPLSGHIDIRSGKISTFAEFTAYPFGFVLAVDSAAPDNRLSNITRLTEYAYGDIATIELQLPSLAPVAPFPGLYNRYKEFVGMRKPETEPLDS